jgi:hypothetical protein
MEVGIAASMPTDEANAEFVGCLGLADELALVDAEPAKQPDERRYGGLADADRTEVFGFDELDRAQLRLQMMAQHRRGEPSGRAATDDYDFRKWSHPQLPKS